MPAGTRYYLAEASVGPWQYQSAGSWVVPGIPPSRCHPAGTTPGTTLPPTPASPLMVVPLGHAHMVVSGRPKEILGVEYAHCTGDGQYPRALALPGLSSLPLQQCSDSRYSSFLSISQYFSVYLHVAEP